MPNIAVVVLDTLRKDVFDRYFEWLPGLRFRNAYSTSHWTIPAHASLFTGRYPSEIGVHGKSRSFDPPETSIVEALQEAGYETRAWSENVQLNTNDGWERGFDAFLRQREFDPKYPESLDWQQFVRESEYDGPGKYLSGLIHAIRGPSATLPSILRGIRRNRRRSSDHSTRDLLKRARQTDFGNDEFLFVNFMTAHTPHHPPSPYRSIGHEVDFKIGDAFAGTIEDPDENRRAYDDSAAYLSTIYHQFFRALSTDFEYIITLSDHGEMLGENGMWNHGYGLYPELVHIPFVISGAGVKSSTRTDVASLLDVPRTLATLAGIGFESRGRDLLGATRSKDRLVEYHGFLPWHQGQFERKGVGDVYKKLDTPLKGIITASNRYVYETHEDRLDSPEDCLRRGDQAHLESLATRIPQRSTTPSAEPSEAVKERLQRLGYA